MHRKGGHDMRFFVVFALSANAVLWPAFAAADSVQAPAGASAKAAPASTAVQAPAVPSQTAAASTASSQTATAATQTGPESVTVQGKAVDLDQIVCKEAPPKIGSRLGGGRECHSEREWRERQQESQDMLRRQQRMGFMH